MDELAKVLAYVEKYWPSEVKPEWQVGLDEYPVILKKVLKDLTEGVTSEGRLVRIAGQSGSGKTSQLLPAVQGWFESRGGRAILVTTARMANYHPFATEIKAEYGEENWRKMTDGFSSVLMLMALKQLMKARYDIILEVSFLDPSLEQILLKMMSENSYQSFVTMVAVPPAVAGKWLDQRSWRHTEKAEKEFLQATERSVEFYAEKCPEMRVVVFAADKEQPIYDGGFNGVARAFRREMMRTEITEADEGRLRQAKIEYFRA